MTSSSPPTNPNTSRIVAPAFPYGQYRLDDGTKAAPPEGWALLPPGDATLTRRVKAAGPSWTVEEKRGRKTFSHGVWAPAATIERERATLEAERATPAYKRQLDQGRQRRAAAEEKYVETFANAVETWLAFAPRHKDLARELARAVADHATPVGSGTVARTQRIPVEQRAEAAVIAWMRHQTTAYDDMKIARVKGARREVRASLAKLSRATLDRYRRGEPAEDCPLRAALDARTEAPGDGDAPT